MQSAFHISSALFTFAADIHYFVVSFFIILLMKRLCITLMSLCMIVSCSKESVFTEVTSSLDIQGQGLELVLESSMSKEGIIADNSFRILRAFQSIPLDKSMAEEVSQMISFSLNNGFDECFFLRELAIPSSEVKVSSLNKIDHSRLLIEEALQASLKNDFIKALSTTNLVIYWPYSDMWDGETLPTITFMPEDEAAEWNYGYRQTVDNNGHRKIEKVIVNDDYAAKYPVWIIKDSEYSYDGLPNFNRGEYEKDGVYFNIPETKSSSDTIHVWRMSSAQVTKQYDNLFQGSSNLEITITYPAIAGYVHDSSIIHTAFTRSEIKNKTWKSVNLLLNTDWTPEELSNGMFVVETDGGETVSTTLTTKFKDPITGSETNVSTTVNYKDDDDIIGKQIYKRSYVFSSEGGNMQSFDDHGFNFFMYVTNNN